MDKGTADYFRDRPGLFLLLLAGLCLATAFIYWPGLDGAFLLDDYSSLVLAARYYPDIWTVTISKLIQGEFPGRPLSMLSFTLNFHEWPQSAWGFKYTNLGLHLATGMLGLWFLMALLERVPLVAERKQPITLALMTTGLWLVHPMNVSTTLYVVQRMTILSTLFSFAALIAFIYGRELLDRAPRRGWLLLLAIYPFMVLLGFLAKENAFLAIPLTLLVAYLLTLKKGRGEPKYYRLWKFIYLKLPILLLAAYFLFRYDAIASSYLLREFTPAERLLTEARILVGYIFQLLIPTGRDITVFHDDIAISSSLLHPTSTIVSVLFLSTALVGSYFLRRRYPLIFFTVAWFLICHALESSFLPLELSFEHRNYMAGFSVLLLVTSALWSIGKRIGRAALPALFAALLLLTGFATLNATTVWGDLDLFAHFNHRNHPDSERATEFYANHLRAKGRLGDARRIVAQYLEKHPDNAGLLMLQLQYHCQAGEIDPAQQPPLDALADTLRHSHHSYGAVELSVDISMMIASNECPILSTREFNRIIDAQLANPNFWSSAVSMHNLYIAKSNLYAKERNLDATMRAVESAIERKKVISSYLLAANILFSANRPDLAEGFILEARKLDEAKHWPLGGAHKVLIENLLAQAHAEMAKHRTEPHPADVAED